MSRSVPALALVVLLATGCSQPVRGGSEGGSADVPAGVAPSGSGTPPPRGAVQTTPLPSPVVPLATDGRPRAAALTVPALGLRGRRVRAYVGTPDDGPGTAIQDAGDLASPHGGGGLVGPGGIGNYLVTGHRTSSDRPFADLPSLPLGARIVVTPREHRLVYEVVRDQRTSFRSAASLRAQSAGVPGHPGRTPTRAMITLSTCATSEDHAAGNYWSDEFHNPEHRLEKVGVLRTISARA